jgi:esterase
LLENDIPGCSVISVVKKLALDLNYRELASESPGRALMMLHGLFGSASNLQIVGRQIAKQRPVILPDLRNHGRSPHADDVSYQAMAEDILRLMDRRGCEHADLLGHSMGGKVAMWLALNYPDRVNHLIVADISPVTYPNRFQQIIKAMQTIDLGKLGNRQQADESLAQYLSDAALRGYLLQNLVHADDKWSWRINLGQLASNIECIMEFPETSAEFAKPVLFIKGERSDYISPVHEDTLYRLFPLAEIQTVQDAAHWVYAEQPQLFAQMVTGFLSPA